ncbi:hypothetical protein R3P38DRAFT_2988100 [Favolaschia claudopus]|uniref:Uncharacterized protein n=1 Tax=Favolaschia claudopus TaxID=2862362 RepID=A0AAW0AU20_9AGAR
MAPPCFRCKVFLFVCYFLLHLPHKSTSSGLKRYRPTNDSPLVPWPLPDFRLFGLRRDDTGRFLHNTKRQSMQREEKEEQERAEDWKEDKFRSVVSYRKKQSGPKTNQTYRQGYYAFSSSEKPSGGSPRGRVLYRSSRASSPIEDFPWHRKTLVFMLR